MIAKLLLFMVFVLFSACQSGLIPCPEMKSVKYRKAGAFRTRTSVTASTEEVPERERSTKPITRQTRPVKSIDSIEEWDCPKPGSKTIPKAVKDKIRKNRKQFESHYRSRSYPDSIQFKASSR